MPPARATSRSTRKGIGLRVCPSCPLGKQLPMDAADSTGRGAVISPLPAALPAGHVPPACTCSPRSVPVLEPAPGGPAERLARRVGATHPVRVFLRRGRRRLRAPRRPDRRSGSSADQAARPRGRLREVGQPRQPLACGAANAVAHRPLVGRLDGGGRSGDSCGGRDPRRRVPRQAEVAAGGLHAVRDLRRVRVIPGDHAHRRARSASGPSPGGTRPDGEFSLRVTSRRRSRSTAACCSCSRRGSAVARSRRSRSHSRWPSRSSSAGRGCTAECTTSPTASRA